MAMLPQDEGAAIIAHYLRQLAQASGRRWTAHNEHDMQRLCELMGHDAEPDDTIPPYAHPQLDTRVTVALDRDPADSDPDYLKWKQRQQDARTVERMVERRQR